MTIEITQCSAPGIWYENKIGRRFEAEQTLRDQNNRRRRGMFVQSSPLFKVRERDYVIVSKQPTHTARALFPKVIEMLEDSDLTIAEIRKEWEKRHGKVNPKTVDNVVRYLKKTKRIVFNGEKRVHENGYKCNVCTLS